VTERLSEINRINKIYQEAPASFFYFMDKAQDTRDKVKYSFLDTLFFAHTHARSTHKRDFLLRSVFCVLRSEC
jgi:hypothetical protein